MYCIEKFFPQWKNSDIHESSPVARGASLKLKKLAKNYGASQYFPDHPLGKVHRSGFVNQDLEKASSLAYTCLTCGRCRQRCPVKIDVPEMIIELRKLLASQEKGESS